MNISVTPNTQKKIELLIAHGQFGTPEELVEHAVDAWLDDATGDIQRGLDDVAAGRVHSPDEVEAYLDQNHPKAT